MFCSKYIANDEKMIEFMESYKKSKDYTSDDQLPQGMKEQYVMSK